MTLSVTARVEVESVGDILEISDRVNRGDINVPRPARSSDHDEIGRACLADGTDYDLGVSLDRRPLGSVRLVVDFKDHVRVSTIGGRHLGEERDGFGLVGGGLNPVFLVPVDDHVDPLGDGRVNDGFNLGYGSTGVV